MQNLFQFLKTPKGLIIAAVVVILVVVIVTNWTTIKGWFKRTETPASGERAKMQQDKSGCYVEQGGQRTYVDCPQ